MAQDGSASATISLPSSTQESQASASPESLITPDLTAKFAEVFGKDSDEGAGEDRQPQRSTSRERQRQSEERESLEGLEGATWEDTGVEGEEDWRQDEQDNVGDPEKDESESSHDQRGEKKDESDKDSTLDPLLRHAAKRNGWTDEEIDNLHTENEVVARRTFERLQSSTRDLASQYSQLGQVKAMGDKPNQGIAGQPQHQPRQQQSDGLLDRLYGDRIPQLEEKYGAGFADDVLKPLMSPVQEVYDHYEQQKQAALGQEISQYFKGLPKELQSLYGLEGSKSQEQDLARFQVCQEADWIRDGAAASGVSLSVSDALDMAATKHSVPHLATLERKRLTQKVQRRSQQRTARPSQRRMDPGIGENKRSVKGAMAAYAEKAGELGYSIA